MFVDFNILNQLGSPAINSNTFANRPAAGQTGRLFVSIDTFEIYRDNGTTWDLIGGPGSSTITGTGTATQVAYFTSSQAIGSSANLFWDNTNTRLGIGTATPGVTLDIHSTGIMAHFNTTSATGNSYLAFQRTGTNVWRLGDQYNAGANFFQIHNTALSNNAVQIDAATNKTTWQAVQTYTTGLARANYLDYNLSVAAGGSFSSPNAITALGASLDLTLAGSATIPSGARSGLDAYNSIGFTGAGTLTHNQGAQIRAYSNVTAGWAFNGSATGTVTHLAGLRALFPDNTGSAINVTNNYALLLNDQTPNTGTVTYTNRWGVYQEGASDLNYFAANTLIGTTTNNGSKLQVNGTATISSSVTAGNYYITASSAGTFGLADLSAAIQTYSGSVSPANTILFYTSGAEKMRLDSAGNLGIGISPSCRLNTFITNDLNTVQIRAESDTSSVLSYTGIAPSLIEFYRNVATGVDLTIQTKIALGGAGGNIVFKPQGTTTDLTPVERMRILTNGNVLIGTTTDAGQKLQVNGSSAIGTTNAILLVDVTNKIIQTKTGGNSRGIYCNFNGEDYFFGDATDTLGLSVNLASATYKLGDLGYINNGTNLAIDDITQIIKTNNNNLDKGLKFDFANNTYDVGSQIMSRIEIFPSVLDANSGIYIGDIGDYNGFIVQFEDYTAGAVNFAAIGDFYGSGNGTKIIVNDPSTNIIINVPNGDLNIGQTGAGTRCNSVNINTNSFQLEGLTLSGTAGALVGYITVIINGTNRKIPYYAV